MERTQLADGFVVSDDKGSRVSIRRPAPHVELIRCEGHARAELIDLVLKNREEILAECGRIALFDDLESMNGYDSSVRLKLTDWGKKHRDRIVAFHILTRSRLVAMGVTVANLALGGHIQAHTNRRAFEDALRAEIARTASSGHWATSNTTSDKKKTSR